MMKALILGLGGIGQRHARNLRALCGDAIELCAYRVRGRPHVLTSQLAEDHTKRVAEEFGIRLFRDLQSALDARPQIAFITNPTSLHIESALACAKAGCDLFIEKPLSHSLEMVQTLIEQVEHRQLIAMVGYQLRFHPCLERFSQIVESGALGRLLMVRATVGEYLPYWHRYEDYREMYAARSDLGGGVVLSQIHELDYLYSLFGMPDRVFALGGHWSDLEIDVEDCASIMMEARVGTRPLPVHLQQDYLQWPAVRNCEVLGDLGRARLDFAALNVTMRERAAEKDELYEFKGFDRNQLFVSELAHFLNCVENRRRPVVDLRDGLASLRVALAVRRSMETGDVIQLGREAPLHVA